MAENDAKDEAARYAAQRANERITEHVTRCTMEYSRIENAFKKNDESHNKIVVLLNEMSQKLVSKDRYHAVEILVYGLAGAIFLAVIGAVMTLVLK